MRITVTRHGRTPPGTGARTGARPGFSIPELLVVLFVVSLLAYVAVPTIQVERFRMDGAARGAMAALVSAQRLAVKRQHDVVVVFDTAAAALRIHQDRDNDGEVDTGEPVRPVRLDERVRFGIMDEAAAATGGVRPVTFTEQQSDLPVVRFLRNGSASEEGAFYLTSARSVRSSAHPEDGRLIRVDRPTGRVRWYRYETSSWVEAF